MCARAPVCVKGVGVGPEVIQLVTRPLCFWYCFRHWEQNDGQNRNPYLPVVRILLRKTS